MLLHGLLRGGAALRIRWDGGRHGGKEVEEEEEEEEGQREGEEDVLKLPRCMALRPTEELMARLRRGGGGTPTTGRRRGPRVSVRFAREAASGRKAREKVLAVFSATDEEAEAEAGVEAEAKAKAGREEFVMTLQKHAAEVDCFELERGGGGGTKAEDIIAVRGPLTQRLGMEVARRGLESVDDEAMRQKVEQEEQAVRGQQVALLEKGELLHAEQQAIVGGQSAPSRSAGAAERKRRRIADRLANSTQLNGRKRPRTRAGPQASGSQRTKSAAAAAAAESVYVKISDLPDTVSAAHLLRFFGTGLRMGSSLIRDLQAAERVQFAQQLCNLDGDDDDGGDAGARSSRSYVAAAADRTLANTATGGPVPIWVVLGDEEGGGTAQSDGHSVTLLLECASRNAAAYIAEFSGESLDAIGARLSITCIPRAQALRMLCWAAPLVPVLAHGPVAGVTHADKEKLRGAALLQSAGRIKASMCEFLTAPVAAAIHRLKETLIDAGTSTAAAATAAETHLRLLHKRAAFVQARLFADASAGATAAHDESAPSTLHEINAHRALVLFHYLRLLGLDLDKKHHVQVMRAVQLQCQERLRAEGMRTIEQIVT